MVTKEEVSDLRKAWRAFYNKWNKDHDGWQEQKIWNGVITKLQAERTKSIYVKECKKFFAFINETPDEVYSNRLEHIISKDPNVRATYEDKLNELKKKLIGLHYKKNSINSTLGPISGFFDKARIPLNVHRGFWTVDETAYVKDNKATKRYPDNSEIRTIYEASSEKGKIALLFGYQNGLVNSDVVNLTWRKLNCDWDRVNPHTDFIPVELEREKSKIETIIVLNPDLLFLLRNLWIRENKPSSGYVLHYRNNKLKPTVVMDWLREASIKALGEKRAKQIKFTDLRDCFNDVVTSQEGFSTEIKDRLMGHDPKGSRGDYHVSPTTIRNHYKKIFDLLTVNGWKYVQKAQGYDVLAQQISDLRSALAQIEGENSAYKTRITNMQSNINDILILLGMQDIQSLKDRVARYDEAQERAHRNLKEKYKDLIN